MTQRFRPCSWCAVSCDPVQIAEGPGAGLMFCKSHADAYAQALEGEPNWRFMIAALERRRRRADPIPTPTRRSR